LGEENALVYQVTLEFALTKLLPKTGIKGIEDPTEKKHGHCLSLLLFLTIQLRKAQASFLEERGARSDVFCVFYGYRRVSNY
jgi:hypothetical protein